MHTCRCTSQPLIIYTGHGAFFLLDKILEEHPVRKDHLYISYCLCNCSLQILPTWMTVSFELSIKMHDWVRSLKLCCCTESACHQWEHKLLQNCLGFLCGKSPRGQWAHNYLCCPSVKQADSMGWAVVLNTITDPIDHYNT